MSTTSTTSTEIRYEREGESCTISVAAGGEAVSRLRVIRYDMRLAGAWVAMGGIAEVVTHPRHRGQGYAARLLRAAVDFMREERYAVSLLFGIADFYHRFGYTPVLPEYSVAVATAAAERLPAAAAVRPARAGEEGPLLALYTRVNAGRNGTVRRTEAAFVPLPDPGDSWWVHPRRILVAEAAGEPAGYAILHGNPERLRVLELGVPAEHVATAGASLVAALAQEAAQRRIEQIRLPLPPDEPLAAFLRRIGCRVEITYPANGDGMGRVVHLEALAEALAPALQRRLETLAAPAGGEPLGSLEFVCPEGSARLALGPGRRLAITLPQQQHCQLLMGYRGIDDIAVEHPGAVEAEALPIVRALFPAGFPHMWGIDHF